MRKVLLADFTSINTLLITDYDHGQVIYRYQLLYLLNQNHLLLVNDQCW